MTTMIRLYLAAALIVSLASGLTVSSRRAFVAGAVTSGSLIIASQQEALAAEPYTREVGGSSRSATQAAFNEQAQATNQRLAKQGFSLDTKEEEASRLSDALGSFSYDSTSSSGKKGSNSKGSAAKK